MGTIRDLSGNGNGVDMADSVVNLLPSGADVTVPRKITRMRGKGAGNVVFRPPGASADITMTLVDGEYVDVTPGTIIRNTGTTVTALHGTQNRSLL